eukprot:1172800-Amphidinium_carterae.1
MLFFFIPSTKEYLKRYPARSTHLLRPLQIPNKLEKGICRGEMGFADSGNVQRIPWSWRDALGCLTWLVKGAKHFRIASVTVTKARLQQRWCLWTFLPLNAQPREVWGSKRHAVSSMIQMSSGLTFSKCIK